MKALSSSFLGLCFVTTLTSSAKAQITTDGTTNTNVFSTNNRIIIENGDRRGSNLFHSFREFSVPRGSEALFNNANDLTNIFSRVTGGNISKIDGLIGANGRANLFLINPAGIVFGEGAFLNIGGSFYGSTADSIIFPNNVEFSASNPQPILTVNAPIGLRFRENPGDIVNQSTANNLGLTVAPGNNLALIGGNISLAGGRIVTFQGNVELASVADNSIVKLEPNNTSFTLEYGEVTNFKDITFNQGAAINTIDASINLRGDEIRLTNGSQIRSVFNNTPVNANIDIQARELLINNQASISAATLGETETGTIKVNIAESAKIVGTGSEVFEDIFVLSRPNSNSELDFRNILNNLTGIVSVTTGQGAAPNINLNTAQLQLQNGGVISSVTPGAGNTGTITINASDSLEIISSGIINSPLSDSTGNGTKLKIKTGTLTISDSGFINSGTLGEGDGSDIFIEASAEINLLQSVPNALFPSGIFSSSGSSSNAKAGDINIDTQRLNIQDGGQIISTSGIIVNDEIIRRGGMGGTIQINANESIKISSINSNNVFQASGIYSATFTEKDAGIIDITTDFLSVTNGGQVNSSTLGQGNAGNIEINTNRLEINSGGVVISATGAAGNGGEIKINATERVEIIGVENGLLGGEIVSASANNPRFSSPEAIITGNAGEIKITTPSLRIEENGQISVSSTELGNGGTLTIWADSLILDKGLITANINSGIGARVNLFLKDELILDNNSQISAEAFGDANGGDITINIDNGGIIAFPSQPGSNGNDIIAVAQRGEGGDISITADSVLGIEERRTNNGNGTNDIDASSRFGLNGNVTLNLPDTNNFQEIVNLSSNVIMAEVVARSACATSPAKSELAILGKGGLPDAPNSPLSAEVLLGREAQTLTNQLQQNIASIHPVKTTQGDIYPARGILVAKDGTVILTAYTNKQLNQRLPKNFSDCNVVE